MNVPDSSLPAHPFPAYRPPIRTPRAPVMRETELREIGDSLGRLTERQRQILQKIIDGMPNKVIALDLNISQRTVEKHREGIMQRMKVRSLAALVRTIVLYDAYARIEEPGEMIGDLPPGTRSGEPPSGGH